MKFSIGSLAVEISIQQFIRNNTAFSYHVFYDKDMRSELNMLCDRYGSDKGELTSANQPYPWPSHTYADFYEARFGICREYIQNVFECGLGTNNQNIPNNMGLFGKPGASLRVWKEFFPNAQIRGADIDKNVLFSEDRILTYYVDQTSPDSIEQLWQNVSTANFDLIIDDGLHTFDAGICFFENSFNKVKPNGLYVIEDVTPQGLIRYVEYFKQKQFKAEFIALEREGVEIGDNFLIAITQR